MSLLMRKWTAIHRLDVQHAENVCVPIIWRDMVEFMTENEAREESKHGIQHRYREMRSDSELTAN